MSPNTCLLWMRAFCRLLAALGTGFVVLTPGLVFGEEYGAIAYSKSTRKYAYSYSFATKAAAQKAALGCCKADDANVVGWVRDGWCALAVGNHQNQYGFGWADTAEKAKAKALKDGRARTKGCYVVLCISACGEVQEFDPPEPSESTPPPPEADNEGAGRGFLGVGIRDVDEAEVESLGLDNTAGALVTRILEDTPAARAGLRPDDVIVRIGDKSVKDAEQLKTIVAGHTPDQRIELRVVRNGKRQKFTVIVGDRFDLLKQGSTEKRPRVPPPESLVIPDIEELPEPGLPRLRNIERP